MAKFCPNCGTEMPDEAMFCTNCGSQFPDVNVDKGNVPKEAESANISVNKKDTGIEKTTGDKKKKKPGCLVVIIIVAIVLALLILLIAIGSKDDSSESASSNASESTETTQIVDNAEAAQPQEIQAIGSDNLKELKDNGIYYGFDTAMANAIAGVLDFTNDDETTVTLLQGGLQYVDEHNEYFPVHDPGIDYFNSVDFTIEKRVIDKYPDNYYGLMHVIGCVNYIEFDNQNPNINKYLNTNGMTYMELLGYCDSSNQYEDIVVYFPGDLPFAYQGSSVLALGTPIGKLVENATGDEALLVLGSFIATVDADYTGRIYYGQTEGESSNAMWMGGWYFNYMSEEKMKSEAIRLKKEHRGFEENATDIDIPIEFIEEGEWVTAGDSQEYTLINLKNIDDEIESLKFSVKSYEDAYKTDSEEYKTRVDRLNRFMERQKDFKYVVHIYTDTQFDRIAYGRVENGTVSLQFDDGATGTLKLSFNKAAWPIITLAKEWYSDNTDSTDGIYLHYSINDNSTTGSTTEYEGTWYDMYGDRYVIEKNGNQYLLKTNYFDYSCELQGDVLVFDNGTLSISEECLQTELATPLAKKWVGDVSENGQYLILCYMED